MTDLQKYLYFCVLMLPILFLSSDYAQDNLARDAENEPIQESLLVRDGTYGLRVLQGDYIFVNGTNVSLQRFLRSYRSRKPDEQNAAYTFLLGVIEATEGKEWCGYRRLKTDTILEVVYLGLQKVEPSRYDERAAYVVTGILRKNSPCKEAR
ncbi:MAG: hypothetical protein LBU43_02765 [Candidatus Accumulibacter sp.]|nr:hypothetical protein [Accumulibacter sp.]